MHSLAGIRSINARAAELRNQPAPEPTAKQLKTAAVKESFANAAKSGCSTGRCGVRAGDWNNR